MLFGKTIVMTGVASGIGARAAELAASLGADVIGIDRNEPKVSVAGFIKGDLSSAQGIDAVISQLPNRFDALANVAGLSGNTGAVATLSVNFYGLRTLAEQAGELAQPGVEGGIVEVSWRQDDGDQALGKLGEIVEGEVAFALRRPAIAHRQEA